MCWDNAFAEYFFSHLKTEFFHLERFGSRFAARTGVMDYIEGIPSVSAHTNHQTSTEEHLAA